MRRAWRLVLVCVLLAAGLVVMPAVPVAAAGVVGDGTAASCMGTTGETALETALAGGGAVSFDCGPDPVTLTLTSQKTISANTQIDGGGLVTLSGGNATRIFVLTSGITLELSNITLSDGNAEHGSGGAINNLGGTLTITNSTLSGNEAGFDGGAIFIDDGTLTFTSSTLSGNEARSSGGAIFNTGGTLTITASTLSGNETGDDGGAIYSFQGMLTITTSTLSGNDVGRDGGAIYNDGTLTITNSALSDNSATGDASSGGAIYNDGILAITTSTLSGNEASDGGAIFNLGGTLTITTSTLSSNEAGSGSGGAIYNNLSSSSLTIISSTLNGNQSSLGGAIFNFGAVDLQTSILANSTGGNCRNFGAITSVGYNLSDDDSCNLSAATNDLPNTEPLLADLDDYGGPTQTHLPLPTSPAINAIPLASCAIDDQGAILPDQRGIARPQDGLCDIGSVEVRPNNQPPSITRVTATPSSLNEGSNTTLSITASDPADDDDGGVLSYAFDCDGNDSFEVGPQSSNETTCSYPDDGVVTVTGRVSDSGGLSDTDSVEVTVANVAPAIALSGAASAAEGSLYTLTLGAVTDPGEDTVNTHIVHWGDGTTESFSTAGPKTHSYADGPAGATITVDLIDEDGTYPGAGVHGPITITNVAPAIALSGATSAAEGNAYTLTLGMVTDPGQDTVTLYTVHWGDGTSESFSTAGAKTHVYADGPANATISVDLTDEDGTHLSAATHGPITIDNLPPAIDQLSATIDGDEIVVSVLASDLAGVLDPLTYAFDCDTSGNIDIGPQDATTARCPQAVLGATQLIRVVVKDGDGGMTEGFVSVDFDYGLCARLLGGLLREAGEAGCEQGEIALSLPGDGPLAVCVGWVGGFMRAAGDCAWSEYALSLPEDGPLSVCVNPLSRLLRVPSGACAWYETERVIGGTPPSI